MLSLTLFTGSDNADNMDYEEVPYEDAALLDNPIEESDDRAGTNSALEAASSTLQAVRLLYTGPPDSHTVRG